MLRLSGSREVRQESLSSCRQAVDLCWLRFARLPTTGNLLRRSGSSGDVDWFRAGWETAGDLVLCRFGAGLTLLFCEPRSCDRAEPASVAAEMMRTPMPMRVGSSRRGRRGDCSAMLRVACLLPTSLILPTPPSPLPLLLSRSSVACKALASARSPGRGGSARESCRRDWRARGRSRRRKSGKGGRREKRGWRAPLIDLSEQPVRGECQFKRKGTRRRALTTRRTCLSRNPSSESPLVCLQYRLYLPLDPVEQALVFRPCSKQNSYVPRRLDARLLNDDAMPSCACRSSCARESSARRREAGANGRSAAMRLRRSGGRGGDREGRRMWRMSPR
ncbi:hypothetical protein AAT19DRAFT_11169 [Rhodotorula toruloides]|uniref:Uncharacterized protein n=1 Tax=Rhodotorula toruloides TaxID=5286 RepID=A0A2S9ZXC5_RHOTO|nr:hypothetical protein AAT19DRAFT_11169 [Rhodotorula toruloides]